MKDKAHWQTGHRHKVREKREEGERREGQGALADGPPPQGKRRERGERRVREDEGEGSNRRV